jgi:Lysozyme inhibitor LprI
MIRPFLVLLTACLGLPAAAGAQPLMLPGARFPDEGRPADKPAANAAATRPVGAKAVTETAILNRDLKRNGSSGAIRIERAGRSELRARVALQGVRLSRPEQACTVRFEEPVAVTKEGPANGLVRITLRIPDCPVGGDLADGALWVRGGGMCRFETQDCQIAAEGLWGPEPSALTGQIAAIEQDRGRADRAVRENYKALTQRAPPQEARAIVSEQAAFSSEREMACRSYAGEASHGFCNARFTEARAARLAARLGVAAVDRPAPVPGSIRAVPSERTQRRPAPIKPPPASLLPNPR